ncbi:outer membrane protein assembly factor BamD [bacterium]|nr:outer membrane protein assembly factor BamD [bacterium]
MRAFIIIFISVLVASCTPYQQVLKKGTPAEKFEAAKKYYKKDDYVRAMPLLEELMGLYFGKPEREEIFYYYAYNHYGLNEFLLAGYYFRSFNNTYPLSDKREEMAYMAAVCDFHKTYAYELDQSNTELAINSLQSFINQYPNSEYIADCNKRIDDLRNRLLTKVYESAKLWYKIGDYKAAMVSCTNALEDYPDMIHRDELMYLIADASYRYANLSVEKVQLERYETALKSIDAYLKIYQKENEYYKEVVKIKEKTTEAIQELEAVESK